MKKSNQNGFTIIEVLIASLVFTTILLLCMEGITRIAKVYVKNSSTTKTSEFVKSFVEEIAQQVRYSTVTPGYSGTNPVFICVSGKGYKIEINKADTDPAVNPIIKINDPGCSFYSDPTKYTVVANSPEPVAPSGMRVLKFSLIKTVETGQLWQIDMRVALGPKDLLIDSANRLLTDPLSNPATANCTSGVAGSEFCSVINISTTVSRRML